jgi:hypothetical protein
MTDTQQPPPVRYLERADLAELFVDHVQQMSFEGGVVLRIELATTRPEPTGKPEMVRTPTIRMVIPAGLALFLAQQIQAILSDKNVQPAGTTKQ